MKRMQDDSKPVMVLALLLMVATAGPVRSAPVGTAFTYQGQLKRTGAPATGNFDFRFRLYDAVSAGAQVGADVLRPAVAVNNGLFTVNLDFGAMAFDGSSARFLQIEVKAAGGGAYTLLTPRQELTPAPYAVYASTIPHHSHFADYWGGTSAAYGLEVDNSAGTGDGIRGYSGATAYNYAGVYAICSNSGTGVYGGNTGSSGHAGYGGYFVSDNYRALYAKGNSAWYAAYFENPSGSSNVGLYVNGSMWVTGAKTGYVVDLALNDGTEALETGDVVVITGNDTPVSGEIPVVKVRKCSAAGSSGVVGIVDQPMIIRATQAAPSNREEDLPRPAGKTAAKADGTAAGTGQYVTVVTLGSFKAVKADASGGAIKPGDLLVASANAGYAMKSAAPAPGTIIGKALGELAAGTGTIPVMVTMH